MQPPDSAEITVPTNNSPLPRGPHTCHHTPPQSTETHLLLTHLQSSLFQRLCTQTHTHIPSCHSLGSLTHRRLTLRCAHTALPHTLTSAKFLSAHTPVHTHTPKWREGVWDRTVSKPAATSDRETSTPPSWRRRWEACPLPWGCSIISHTQLIIPRVPRPLEACPGPRVQHVVHSLESLAS